jgi:hypothetical protein
VEELAQPGLVVQIGVPPSRIDLLTAIDGVEFDEAWSTRISTDVEGHRVHVIAKSLLIRNKKAAGRRKDLLDADHLEEQ